MKADFTRRTFDARRHATDVLKQQGRVDLDADWNEQQDIAEYLRTLALTDVVGPVGGPVDAAAFAVRPVVTDLLLSPGRYYVGGVLCENDAEVSLFDAQPDLPDGLPRIVRADGTLITIAEPVPPAVYLVYLDVWSQLRTAVEDPALREVALGGPDTAVRRRTVWQAWLVEAAPVGSEPPCTVVPAPWDALTAASTGTLEAFARPAAGPTSDCDVPLSAPYRGLDNSQYRVEIHTAGGPGTASYKWSRDNGSTVATWQGTVGDVLTVTIPGRDGASGFPPGSWAELTDDVHELTGRPGTLVKVTTPQGDQIGIDPATATGSLDPADFPLRPRLRRWDGFAGVPDGGGEAELELGIRVRFGTGAVTYRTGDYWSFAARAATHDVEWPSTGAAPVALAPHGPAHRFARLALVNWDGTAYTLVRDCRPLFAPLTDQVTLSYVGGDGQLAVPAVGAPATLVPLAQPLVVGAQAGGRPVSGATVEFTVALGNGQVGGAPGPARVVTDGDGLGATPWAVDSGTLAQQVTTTLLGPDLVTPRGLPVHFGARLARADLTSYDPAASPALAGTATVQDAIDRLAAATGGGCATLVLSPGNGWAEALRQLPEATDAVVCFRPGTYEAAETIVVKGLGHVSLHGGGAATRLVVAQAETALRFEACASVELHDLEVSVAEYPKDPQTGLLGVVTTVGCGDVAARRVSFTCPAAADLRATCLTVRGGGAQSPRPTVTSAVVERCTFTVGHAQEAVLVLDCESTVVTGCTFRVPTLPQEFDLKRLLGSKRVRSLVTAQLLSRTVLDRGVAAERPSTRFTTSLKVGTFVARMNSTVPQEEWQALLAQQPPSPEDLASAESVQAFVHRLTDTAVRAEAPPPAFKRSIGLIRRSFGQNVEQLFNTDEGRTAVTGLITGGEVDVQPVTAVARGLERAVALPAGSATVRFDSPLSQNTWEAVLSATKPRQQTAVSVASAMRDAARRIVMNPAFGDRFAAGFRAELQARVTSAAGRAIVVAGGTIGTVDVAENTIDGFVEGVHIAGSVRGGPGTLAVMAAGVRVRSNTITLAVPVELTMAPRAIFVGGTSRVSVLDNAANVGSSGGRAGESVLGIQVEGIFGSHLLVRDNLLDNCRTGVLIRNHGSIPPGLWLAADNTAPHGQVGVDAPAPVRVTGNTP